MLALDAALDVWEGGTDRGGTGEEPGADGLLPGVRGGVRPGGARTRSLTPAAHAERGSQVALRCAEAPAVMEALIGRGVVGDLRRPDLLRFGFTPLYTGFADTERAARVLGEVLREVPGASSA